MLGWLGTTLAAHGYIAAAVNHPGNNRLEPYTPAGFSLWWERATDLSEVIDQMLADPEFAARIDSGRIGAAGFSLGGYTTIELAGGISDRAAYPGFCNSKAADAICKSPPEFPQLVDYFNRLDEAGKSDPEIAASLQQEREPHRDSRVRAVFALAPALGPAFRPAALSKIGIPVQIMGRPRGRQRSDRQRCRVFCGAYRGLEAGAAARRRTALPVPGFLHGRGASEPSLALHRPAWGES